MLKAWLNEKGQKYEVVMVDENQEAAQKMYELSGGQMAVPFTTIEFDDGTVEKILGFDRPRFETALKTA
jgi:glutaredoxin